MTDDMGGDPGGTLFSSRRNRSRSTVPTLAWLGIPALLILGLAVWWFWFRTPEPALEPLTATAPDTLNPAPESEHFVVPPLNASDAAVRALVEGVSAHPQLAAWLVPDDLIRRFVEAVVDISRGSSPLPAMEMLIPPEPFMVDRSDDSLLMDPRSQRRYDLLAQVVASIDPRAAARVYHQLLPLFREAYQEMGVSDGPFPEVLARAMDNLLAVDVPDGPLELREAVGRYVYSDRSLESLTPAAKHLLRMGPENARMVQEKLREIESALDLSGEGAATDSLAADSTPADTVAAGSGVVRF